MLKSQVMQLRLEALTDTRAELIPGQTQPTFTLQAKPEGQAQEKGVLLFPATELVMFPQAWQVALAPLAAKTTWVSEVQTQVPNCAFQVIEVSLQRQVGAALPAAGATPEEYLESSHWMQVPRKGTPFGPQSHLLVVGFQTSSWVGQMQVVGLSLPTELVVLSQGTQVMVFPLWTTTLLGPQVQLKLGYSHTRAGVATTQLQLKLSFLVVVKVPAVPHLKQV